MHSFRTEIENPIVEKDILDLAKKIAQFKAGEIHALMGPNGSGKSTLLWLVSGLLRLADGSMSLDGRCLDSSVDDVYVSPEDRNIGMMFQSLHLVNQMTVIDNVALALRARGSSRNDARVVAQEHLDAVGAGHLAHRKASELSGGEAQRVALARAIATRPAVLLLDEPLSAIDAESKEPLRTVLDGVLRAYSGIALLVTHDLNDVESLASRSIRLGP
jgi:molybdate transport system ATP-binding protein